MNRRHCVCARMGWVSWVILADATHLQELIRKSKNSPHPKFLTSKSNEKNYNFWKINPATFAHTLPLLVLNPASSSSMSPHRSTVLLVLLVVLPLSLLAWLGTYLHQDGERRAEANRAAVLTERVQVAAHRLTTQLQLLVQELDTVVDMQEEKAVMARSDSVALMMGRAELGTEGLPLQADAQAEADEGLLELLRLLAEGQKKSGAPGDAVLAEESAHFEPLPVSLPGRWRASRLVERTAEGPNAPGMAAGESASGLLVQENPGVPPEWVHWRRREDGSWSALRLDGAAVHQRLLGSLSPSGITPPPGTMLLLNDFGANLHSWGQTLFKPGMEPELTLACATPLKRWRVGYVSARGEFPSAALFPILLGITSGSLVVPALAWLYFRESSREIRVAHQRVSFVNQVSHELKTPLTNIRLYAEMARTRAEDRGDEAAVRQLTVVEAETARLSRLIQNVLNFARKQRDRLTVMLKPCDLNPMLTRLVDHWQPVLEKRGLALEVSKPDRLEVMADADAVEQILGNLLSNAEKYALDGRWVGLSVIETPDRQAVEVSVTDRGPGIPPAKVETIFEPFERLRSDLREGVSGTGIGLTISRELAQLMGGHLRVDAEHRGGARFVLTLPKAAPTPESAKPAREGPSRLLTAVAQPS